VLYARAHQLPSLLYYYFTYNRVIYLDPVTAGYAIESTYLYARNQIQLLLITALLCAWVAARVAARSREHGLFAGIFRHSLSTTTALNLLVALTGAVGTFRFWGHYFITALPWFGFLVGLVLEEHLRAPAQSPSRAASPLRIALPVGVVVALSFILCPLTRIFLDGQRRAGSFANPSDDPVVRYIGSHSRPADAILVWGFAPDLYVSAHRKSATRFVFTTFPAGIVPWFHWMSLAQENALQVPGARAVMLQELAHARPPLVVDVPDTLHGRSIRRYDELAAFVESNYCFDTSLQTGGGRLAFIYRRRDLSGPCTQPLPPLPRASE
ncbi:MAG: hypothetical protein MUF54_14350, partial [Polyangiaceae bacterium]|nr:hypothetical protein [Polyangiaceae bacterium]